MLFLLSSLDVGLGSRLSLLLCAREEDSLTICLQSSGLYDRRDSIKPYITLAVSQIFAIAFCTADSIWS